MAVTISGDTGISAVQAGAVESGDLPTGSVIQVVQTTSSATSASTSSSDVEIFNASITPSSATSKILIMLTLYIGSGNNETYWCKRNSTKIGGVGGSGGSFVSPDSFYNSDEPMTGTGVNRAFILASLNWNYLDSPSTTSSITYSIGHQSNSSSPEFYINRTENSATSGRGTSTLTLMEIAG